MIFNNIRWRIAVPYALLIVLVISGIYLYLSDFLRSRYLDDVETRLTAEARLAAAALGPQLAGSAPGQDYDQMAKDWAAALDSRVTIIDASGVVIGESHENRIAMDNHAGRPEVTQARLSGAGMATRYSVTVGYDMMYVAAAIREDGKLLGYARMAVPLNKVEEAIRHLQRSWALASGLALLLSLALALWIAGRTTRPLRELTEAAGQMGRGQMETRLIPRGSDEIGQLTRTFNEMAGQISSQIQDLQAERSRMAAVLGEMSDGVIIVDGSGRIQLINQAVQAIFKIRETEAQGQTLIQALRQHQVVELWQACLLSGSAQSSMVEIPAQRLYLHTIATPLGEALPGSTLLLFQDLTRLRRLETVRQDFISNISHELRTPLASLKALTETLQEGALEDPPAARRFLERMLTEVDALTQMVEELLELSRIESGKVPLRLLPVAPEPLLQAAYERLRVQAERAGLSVSIDCPQDLPPVLADAQRLSQVIVNLLHNAIKFTPAGGQIRLQAEPAGEMVRFLVQDTGVGINPNDLPRIFERFFKADRARATGGTGLGLAIARHQVEAHGGRIWVESAAGQGSSFFFEIPNAS
ncbi:MAG: ATP-binding protein [Chloroflexota bacterium]